MKCVILAGGSGDALWPLSRKNYPKQFINIRKGRSLFQEAIARNLPFCDDFYIITNEKYRYIVEGQVQAFQGLSYQLFLEEMGRQTAPAVAVATMCIDKDEDVLVVSTDHLIDEGDYNKTILAAKDTLNDHNVVVIGCDMDNIGDGDNMKGHSAFVCKNGQVVDFISSCTCRSDYKKESAPDLPGSEILLDSGIFMMKAGVYLEAIRENAPDLYRKCQLGTDRVRLDSGALLITKEWLSKIPSLSVGEVVFANWAGKNIVAVKALFRWSRLLNMEMLAKFDAPSLQGPKIVEHSHNVSVLNQTDNKLVVVNGCDDLMIVNTSDAIYISEKGESAAIKDLMQAHYEEQKDIFDEGNIFYTTWGIKETLNHTDGYMVRKVTLFPGKEIALHKHEKRCEHCSIVSGNATITIDGVTREFGCEDNVFIPVGSFHRIANVFAKDLVFIEVSVGDSAGQKTGDMVRAVDDFVKLGPAYKDYLWGGTRLYEKYGKDNADNKDHVIAESWEISAHSAGPSRVVEGNAKGMMFPQYLEKIGKEAWGWKCKPFERFPLLVKLIDATKSLSVQVHPDDEYAMSVEGEYGKNEMWYIMEAKPGACLWCGFNRPITKAEIRERVQNGTLMEVLNRVPVQKGDTMMIPAGTVHAIGEGLVICEVQQSSNVTYRLYDYGRRDKNGALRTLHIEKALNVLNLSPGLPEKGSAEPENGGEILCQCKYFTVERLHTKQNALQLAGQDSSFTALVFLQGQGTLQAGEDTPQPYRAGDTFFLPAGNVKLTITGTAELLRVMV